MTKKLEIKDIQVMQNPVSEKWFGRLILENDCHLTTSMYCTKDEVYIRLIHLAANIQPVIKPRLRLKRNSQWNEWIVRWYDFSEEKGFTVNEDKSYHTDDKEDALQTMNAMQKQIDEQY